MCKAYKHSDLCCAILVTCGIPITHYKGQRTMTHNFLITACAALLATFAYLHTAQADNTAAAGEPQAASTESQCDKTCNKYQCA